MKAKANANKVGSYGDFSYPDHPEMTEDFVVNYDYADYSEQDHQIWSELLTRQMAVIQTRACREYLESLESLSFSQTRIPRIEELNELLERRTNWRIVTVPGLIPGDVFLKHLASRRFPLTYWIRPREKFDYLIEPDIFHDLFGHVPLLINPVFADYMEAFGKGAIRAAELAGDDENLKSEYERMIAALYWFTVEFGLIRNEDGIKIYGAGILSSKGESVYSVESPVPNRIRFNVRRVMNTQYHIDDFQKNYFVIDSFEHLFSETFQDFKPIYRELANKEIHKEGMVVPGDEVYRL